MRYRLVCFSLLALALAGSTQAATIELTSEFDVVDVAQPFPLELVVSGLGERTAPSLGAFDLDLVFDPAVLVFTDLSYGPYLGVPTLEAITSTGGMIAIGPAEALVRILEVSLLPAADLDALQPGRFTLATLWFAPSGFGATTVTPSGVLSNALGGELPAAFAASRVTVIPEPSALVPLGFALAVMGVAVRCRSRRRSTGKLMPVGKRDPEFASPSTARRQ